MSTQAQQAQDGIKKNIIEIFKIDKLPEEEQEKVIAQIGKIIFQATLMRTLPLLEEEDMEAYNKMMDENPDPEKVMEFFLEKVPTFLDIVTQESEALRDQSEDLINKL